MKCYDTAYNGSPWE